MYYLLDTQKKEVIEMKEVPDIEEVLESIGITYYKYFPYEVAGYEDPYAFMEDYKLIKLTKNLIEVD